MAAVHYESTRAAREHLSGMFTAAEEGRPASVRRTPEHLLTIMDGARFARFYRSVAPSRAQIVYEEGNGVALILPALPIHGDGDSLDEAVTDTVAALRDYAEDWSDHLRHAPNHAENDMLVQFIAVCDDGALRDWLLAG